MTIKDIAKAANVSAATVSRIINHKDDNISQETRERVLRVIAEHDYVPYAKIRERILSQSHSIGLMVPTLDSAFYVQFASAIQQLAREYNYSLVLALTSGSAAEEASTLNNFDRNHTDGVILFSGSPEGLSQLKQRHEQGLAVVTLHHQVESSTLPKLYRDSAQIARDCTQLLLKNNCSQIGLALRSDCPEALRETIWTGYRGALSAAGLAVQQNFAVVLDEAFVENFRGMADAGLDGIVCQDADIAKEVYAAAVNDELRIPEDISVVAMEDAADAENRIPALTAASTNVVQMARMAFECLLSQIEHTPLLFSSQKMESTIQLRASVRMRRSIRPRILVAGYINTDILLRTPDLPQLGKTQVTAHIADYVGGRGANQAYGISRLGGDACLLGRLGSDRRGRFAYDHMVQAGVRMDGVSFQSELPTGTAYISLYPSGKSSVLIDPGANTTLDADYIRQHEHLVREADLCLAQTDIPLESIAALRELCLQHRVPMILRPSYGVRLPDDMVQGLYILTMKEQERQMLYPQFESQEACAAYFLSLGAQNVIFTQGSDGCFWANREGSHRCPGYNYPCVDETGTSDVFIGCLATLLSEKQSLAEAIRAACWAAAYSATRLGVQSGFPDRKLLEDVVFGGLQLHFSE